MPQPPDSLRFAGTSAAVGANRTAYASALPPRHREIALSQDSHEALAEAQALSTIDSEHFARLFRFLETDHGLLAEVERVRGVDVRTLLGLLRARGQGLRPATAAAIVYQACRGLQEVQETASPPLPPGLRPANLRLSRSGVVKWIELEWRRHAPPESLLCAPERLAPELAAGLPLPDEAAPDLYGLAALLFELLTGQPLIEFPGNLSPAAQLERVARQPARDRVALCPRPFRPVLERALNWDPRLRFTSPGQLADALASVIEQLEPAAPLDMFCSQLYQVVRFQESEGLLASWLEPAPVAPPAPVPARR